MASELRSAAGETLEFEIGPVERDEPAKLIASSSNGAITTTTAHGYSAEDLVRVDDHLGNPIDGTWEIASIDSSTSFTLDGVPTTNRAGGATGTVTRLVPVDLSLTDTIVLFSAKETLDTVNPYVEVEASRNSPSSPRKNLATVTIDGADTELLDESTDFYFDVWLTEPDDRMTRLDRGIWKVGVAVAA